MRVEVSLIDVDGGAGRHRRRDAGDGVPVVRKGAIGRQLETTDGARRNQGPAVLPDPDAAAQLREETRGSHWRDDFPDRDDADWAGHLDWVVVDGLSQAQFRAAAPTDVPVAVEAQA